MQTDEARVITVAIISGAGGRVPTREPLGFAHCSAALHVDDLVVSEGDHLEAFLSPPVAAGPRRRADDRVGSELSELRLHLDAPIAALLDLELQDLTGLVGSASGRCLLPPEVSVRQAAPLGVVREQGGEGCWIAVVECVCCGSELVDHGSSFARPASARTAATRPRHSRSSRPRRGFGAG